MGGVVRRRSGMGGVRAGGWRLQAERRREEGGMVELTNRQKSLSVSFLPHVVGSPSQGG